MGEERIEFFAENDFQLSAAEDYKNWIMRVISSEGKNLGELSYIFCDDDYLVEMNKKFLSHDTYTDVIGFEDNLGTRVGGDIFISTERVSENSISFGVTFEEELRRVMIHGLLHFCGYSDKNESEKRVMRNKEDEKLRLFHVEQ